jgi:hypothetical protein
MENKMKSFSQIRTTSLSEALKTPKGEKQIKKFKVGKNKYEAIITKKGSSFIGYIDGDKLDSFKNAKEAEKAINDFTKLMEK